MNLSDSGHKKDFYLRLYGFHLSTRKNAASRDSKLYTYDMSRAYMWFKMKADNLSA